MFLFILELLVNFMIVIIFHVDNLGVSLLQFNISLKDSSITIKLTHGGEQKVLDLMIFL